MSGTVGTLFLRHPLHGRHWECPPRAQRRHLHNSAACDSEWLGPYPYAHEHALSMEPDSRWLWRVHKPTAKGLAITWTVSIKNPVSIRAKWRTQPNFQADLIGGFAFVELSRMILRLIDVYYFVWPSPLLQVESRAACWQRKHARLKQLPHIKIQVKFQT